MAENIDPKILDAAIADYERKQLKAKTELHYYDERIAELGITSIDRFVEYCPDPSKLMRMHVTFAHRDLESVVDAMDTEEPLTVVSGLNPSGPLHFGHKQVFDDLLWMQQRGAEIFIPISNDESYVVGKSISLGQSRKEAYNSVIPSIIAMGFDPEKTHIYVDSDYSDIYNVAMDLSKELSINRLFGVFGFGKGTEGENLGTIFYRGAVQIAHILLPQYEEFGGPKPSVIPVGVDQYPYILLARDVAERKSFIPPAATFTKFGEGLDGKGKMSTSREKSSIYLTDTPDVAQKKIRSSYTGGSIIAAYQKEHGGVPEICPIFQLRTRHFDNDDLADACSKGEILCADCKRQATEEVTRFIEDHQEKLPDAREHLDDFMLVKPIKSVIED